MLDWRILYSNGAFGSNEGSWLDAPAWDVQLVIMPHEAVGRVHAYEGDFYVLAPWYAGERPLAVDKVGMFDYLRETGATDSAGALLWEKPYDQMGHADLIRAGVKFGRTISDEVWSDVWQRALADTDFPPKSAKFKSEGRGASLPENHGRLE